MMTATRSSWWQQIKQHRYVTGSVVLLVLVLILFIFLAYRFDWDWTGISGGEINTITISTPQGTYKATEVQSAKNFWDWLSLLGVPVVAGLGIAWFTQTQKRRDHNQDLLQRDRDRVHAEDQRSIAALQEYIDRMSELLLHEKLYDSAEEDKVRKIAHIRTLTILSTLNAGRKRSLLEFLYEWGLIETGKSTIDLKGAALSETDLSEAKLSRAALRGANLSGADLSRADLSRADLSEAALRGAKLWAADLSYADLSGANLWAADLSYADLSGANLNGANLNNANLRYANLSKANLSEVQSLDHTDLRGVKGLTKKQLEACKAKGIIIDEDSTTPTSVEPTSVEPTSVEPTSVEPTSVTPT
jgi:pentapeptide repeat protein